MPTSMNIFLPETMKEVVDGQEQSDGYGGAGEYIRDLVRRDQKERMEARLETLLLDGPNSGEDIPRKPTHRQRGGYRVLLLGKNSVHKSSRIDLHISFTTLVQAERWHLRPAEQ